MNTNTIVHLCRWPAYRIHYVRFWALKLCRPSLKYFSLVCFRLGFTPGKQWLSIFIIYQHFHMSPAIAKYLDCWNVSHFLVMEAVCSLCMTVYVPGSFDLPGSRPHTQRLHFWMQLVTFINCWFISRYYTLDVCIFENKKRGRSLFKYPAFQRWLNASVLCSYYIVLVHKIISLYDGGDVRICWLMNVIMMWTCFYKKLWGMPVRQIIAALFLSEMTWKGKSERGSMDCFLTLNKTESSWCATLMQQVIKALTPQSCCSK